MVNRRKGGEYPFEVQFGRMRSPSGQAKLKGFFKQVRKSAQRISVSKRGYRQTQQQSTAQFQRRVLIKMHVQPMAQRGAAIQAQHLRYIQRDSAAREGDEGHLFDGTSDDADAQAFEERGHGDRHQFRMIVSPEDAAELADLKAYTRDLVSVMEHDLETQLDWVAADHHDTGQPHVHVIIAGRRDSGQDLVLPKRYIGHGIRRRAQELVNLELGPVLELDGRKRLARMVRQERYTDLDRQLGRTMRDGKVDLARARKHYKPWQTQLLKQRLNMLERFGFAAPLGQGRWRLNPDTQQTLTQMGERGDMIKAMHRAMDQNGKKGLVTASSVFDPSAARAHSITGQIIDCGVADDVRGRGYIIVDGIGGAATYVDIGQPERLDTLHVGDIVKIDPPPAEPRGSDERIHEIASRHGGRYSTDLHEREDPRARPAFIEAHVRRLEALRRAGHAQRHSDGSWSLPPDYLARAGRFERQAALSKPVEVTHLSRLPLEKMVQAIGNTWLETVPVPQETIVRGFGAKVQAVQKRRRAFLVEQGFLEAEDAPIAQRIRQRLERADLAGAAAPIAADLHKPYKIAPTSGEISGHYLKPLERPSGKFAVIERARDFTLVPWREIMDRRLGQSIVGQVHRGGISWSITRGHSLPPY